MPENGQELRRDKTYPAMHHHRTFNVASPIRARIHEMIQNRMTICGSAQPFFPQWWWIGAISNTRLPVRLKY